MRVAVSGECFVGVLRVEWGVKEKGGGGGGGHGNVWWWW